MINIFICRKYTFTITPFLKSWPSKASGSIRLFPYEYLHRIRRIKPGLFIFTDIDRLNPEQRKSAIYLSEYITRSYGDGLVLNQPQLVLTRYHLLTKLWEKGINRFRVFTPAERTGLIRFPVFIRRVHDHKGPLTDLIKNKKN